MMSKLNQDGTRAEPHLGDGRFATLSFERVISVPSSVLWQVWTSPAARAIFDDAAKFYPLREARAGSGDHTPSAISLCLRVTFVRRNMATAA